MNTIHCRAAHVTGRDHTLSQRNRQDSHTLIETDEYVIGVVCDGCGEGTRSEVGAALASQFIAGRAADLLHAGICPLRLPPLLYRATVDFLKELLDLVRPTNLKQFSMDHLLFTVLGVVITPTAGAIFAAGDGLITIDNQVYQRDENNCPSYIGYHLFPPTSLAGSRPLECEFDVYPLGPDWRRLAIASDGFELELLPGVWGLKQPRALQRKFNVWSDQDHRFRDDATLLLMERD